MLSAGAPARVRADAGVHSPDTLATLVHRLNNQLGAGLAHAELIEIKSCEESDRVRAAQVVRSLVEAMVIAQEICARVAASAPLRD